MKTTPNSAKRNLQSEIGNLKFLRYCATLLLLTLAIGNVRAETETITFTSKDWSPWTSVTDGSSFESSGSNRGVANNKVDGQCVSTKEYPNVTEIVVVCSSNATGGKVSVSVGEQTVATKSISKSNNDTYTYTVNNLSGKIKISVTKNDKTVWVKSVTITYTPASTCTTPTFTIGDKTISVDDGTVDWADLSINKDGSSGAITYALESGVSSDDAAIDESGFYAYTADTYTITATMAADDTYCEAETTFTITVTAKALDPLATPTGLSSTNITATGATLSWNAVTNATKYVVTVGGETYETTSTSYTVSGLTAETTYSWTVKAIGDDENYGDSDESSTSSFTTAALPTYTITWSSNGSTFDTEVTQGSAVTLPTTDPTSCSETHTQFVGWFTTAAGSESNPSTAAPTTQVTNATRPTESTTYYAVFSDATGSGETDWQLVTSESDLVAGATYTLSSTSDKTGKVLGTKADNNYKAADWSSTTTPIQLTLGGTEGSWTFYDTANKGYLYAASSSSNYLKVQSANDANGQWTIAIASSGSAATIKAQGTNTRNLLKYNSTSSLFSCYSSGQDAVYLFKRTGGSSASGYISTCCSDAAVVTVTPAATSLNLGESGSATTTVTCTQAGGGSGSWSYSVSPTTATFDGTTFTATAAGTYTVTATYTENCAKSGSATITVTKLPVFETPTIDRSIFEASCGDTTSMNTAATITLGTNYNLTQAVTVTAPEGFLVSTNKTDKTKYAESVTLKPTATGANAGKITVSVYVRAYSAAARTEGYSGNITFTGDEIETKTIAISSTVTCTNYDIVFNNRGGAYHTMSGYATTTVDAPDDPTGVCTTPTEYQFAGWSETKITGNATSVTFVSFPYTIPKGGKTLYAVYKWADTSSGDGNYHLVTSAPEDWSGEYLIVSDTKAFDGSLTTLDVATNNFTVTISDNTIAASTDTEAKNFTIAKNGDYYTIQSKSGKYIGASKTGNLNASTTVTNDKQHTLSLDTDGNALIVPNQGSNTDLTLQNNGGRFRYYTIVMTAVQLYCRVTSTNYYTTSPICGPYLQITSGNEVYVTSGNAGNTRNSVEAQDTIRFVAGSLVGSGTNAPEVQVFVNQAKYQHNVSDGTLNRNISTTITQDVTQDGDTYSIKGYIVVKYAPSANNTLETVRIVPHILYNTTAMLDSATVYARALPEKFVIAAQNAGKWYALPADMATSSTYLGNGQLVVDDETNPTAATLAPCNTVYTFDGMPNGSDLRYARFVGLNSKYLWASSDGNTGIQNYAVSATGANLPYNWLLQTTDLTTYTVGNAQNSRSLSISTASSTLNNFGMYANSNVTALRILPITDTCAYNAAPQGLRVSAKTSSTLTLTWAAVAGADAYQYSTDGATWTNIASIDLAAPSLTITGLNAGTEYTIYIRAKHGTAENICSDQTNIVATTTNCDEAPTVTATGTVTQECGTVSLGSDFVLTATAPSDKCPVTAYGIEYSTDPTFAQKVKQVPLTVTSGEVADIVTILEPGDYYFRAYATNEVGTGYSATINGGALVDVTGVAGLKIMFENNDNTAPLVAGQAKKRVVYYSESPAEVTWTVSPNSGKIADGYFYASAMGVYTLTATQAAHGDYCESSTSAVVEVRTPRYHSFVTNCAKLNNGNIEVINQHRDYMDVAVDSADIVKLTIVRDNTGQSTGVTGNVAEELFFSKYFEATGNVKLFAIYNGTKDKIDLSSYTVKIGRVNSSSQASWASTIDLSAYGKEIGYIGAGEEIIVYSTGTDYPNCKGSTINDCSIIDCVKEKGKFDFSTAYLNTSAVVFSGNQQLVLCKNADPIDILGSITENSASGMPVKVTESPNWGDDSGWVGYGGNIQNDSEKIALSMNRTLLIRKNTVTSGANTLTENINSRFNTLGTYNSSDKSQCIEGEWNGMQIPKSDGDNGVTASCDGFEYVASFDYKEYFQRYEPISDSIKIVADGKRNPDGTFRIDASDIKLDGFTDFSDLSCSSIKIQGFKDGSDQPSTTLDYKVPIIVDASTTTADKTLFDFDGQGRVICPECDVVIRDNAKLEVVQGGYNQLRDVYVYHTGRLQIEEGRTYNTRHVYVSSDNNDVGYALVEGTLSALLGVGHYKRIDALAWYDFSLPYNCKVADIARSNGKSLGEYGKDWFIKYYDGQKRAISGTPNGATPTNWEHVPATGTLKAGVGYIIGMGGLHEVEPNLPQYKVRISLPNVSGQIYTETNVSDQQLPVTGYTGAKAEELPCHRGWNYIGNPFISRFDGSAQIPEWSTDLLLNGYYTDGKTGTTYDVSYPDIYVAVDEGTGGATDWVQTEASAANLLPFRAFFVQAVSDGKVDFVKTARNLPAGAPASRATDNANSVSQFNLVLTNASGVSGITSVMIGDQFSRSYEVGYDMLRMINTQQSYPQPYTIDSAGYAMIRQAIDRESPVNQSIPVGFYLRSKGNYTFSIDRLQGMSRYDAIYLDDNLLHNTTNLLLSDYTFSAAAKTTEGRFSLRLCASQVPTSITDPDGGVPVVYRHGDALVIESLPANAQVRIVDAIGRVLHQQHTDGGTITFHAPVRGAYLIQVVSGNDSYSIKTIL